jgi:hypothetical protein
MRLIVNLILGLACFLVVSGVGAVVEPNQGRSPIEIELAAERLNLRAI